MSRAAGDRRHLRRAEADAPASSERNWTQSALAPSTLPLLRFTLGKRNRRPGFADADAAHINGGTLLVKLIVPVVTVLSPRT